MSVRVDRHPGGYAILGGGQVSNADRNMMIAAMARDTNYLAECYPCNHPRTPENTKPNGKRPGGRCRTCQQAHERVAQAKRRAAGK